MHLSLSGRKTWNDVLTAIFMVARDKWGWFDGDLQNLMQQLLSYKHGAARFTTCPDSYDDPLEYWRQVPDHCNTAKAKEFALKLFDVCPSAVETERLFSQLSDTKSKKRNQMRPIRLRAHAQMQAYYRASYPYTGKWKSFTSDRRLDRFVTENDSDTVAGAMEAHENAEDTSSAAIDMLADVSFDIDSEEDGDLPEFVPAEESSSVRTLAEEQGASDTHTTENDADGTGDGEADGQFLTLDDIDTHLEDSFLMLRRELQRENVSHHVLRAAEEYDLDDPLVCGRNESRSTSNSGSASSSTGTSCTRNLSLENLLNQYGSEAGN
jgi:hypothetical protein